MSSFPGLDQRLSRLGHRSRAALEERAQELRVDPRSIFGGRPVRLKKCEYTGFATTIYSIDHAIACLEYIGLMADSEDCLPFACSLVEAGELLAISEDNGDFGSGEVLAKALDRLKNYNVLVCVARATKGCFVTDMLLDQKSSKVKEAAEGVLDTLLQHLAGRQRGSSVPGAILNSNSTSDGPILSENRPKYCSIDDIFANTYKVEADPQLKTAILDILVDHYNLLLASGTYYSPLQFSKQFNIPSKFFEAYWMSKKPETTGVHKSDYEEFVESRPKLKPKALLVDQIVKMPSPEENPYYDPSPPPNRPAKEKGGGFREKGKENGKEKGKAQLGGR